MQVVKCSSSLKAQPRVVRRTVRPVAKMNQAQLTKVAGGLALVGGLAFAAAPAEAHNVLSTLASAAEGYPFVPPAWAPSILVPLTGLVIPGIAMAALFSYIEKEA